MATFGGTGTEALKDGIDKIFAENGPLHLPEDEYNKGRDMYKQRCKC